MASKSTDSLSNKKPVALKAKASTTALLASLPPADEVQRASAAAPAAAKRREDRAEREADQKDRNAHTETLLQEYFEFLVTKFTGELESAKAEGWGWLCVEKAFPPTKELIRLEDGCEALVFKHEDATLTHWAGMADGAPKDPKEGGAVPKVMLLQGCMPKGSKVADTKLLPGGKSVTELLREALAGSGYGVQTLFAGGKVQLFVIWDHKAWKVRQEKARPRTARSEADDKPQKTYDEYQAEKAAKRAKAPGAAAPAGEKSTGRK